VLFADLALPTLADLRAALDWAFEGEDVTPEYLDRCAEHSLLVQEASRRMNLTKIVDPRESAAKHYLDCWRAAQMLPLLGKTVLDLGSGAGYPGVPIALAEPNADPAGHQLRTRERAPAAQGAPLVEGPGHAQGPLLVARSARR